MTLYPALLVSPGHHSASLILPTGRTATPVLYFAGGGPAWGLQGRPFFCLRDLFPFYLRHVGRDTTSSSLCGNIDFAECQNTTGTMSKLSPALKALISARFAMPDTVAAPKHIRSVYQTIEREAASKDVGLPSWLAISVRPSKVFAMRQCVLTRWLHIDRCNDDN